MIGARSHKWSVHASEVNSNPRSSASGRTNRGAVSVTRLHRDGDDALRVLMVADVGVTAAPRDAATSHFADQVTDRLWLRMRRGFDVDVVQEPWGALRAIAASFASWTRSPYDLVVFVVDPAQMPGVREQRGFLATLQSVLMHLALSTRVVLVILESDEGSARHRRMTDFSTKLLDAVRSPSVRLSTMQIPQSQAGSADAIAQHLQLALRAVRPLILPLFDHTATVLDPQLSRRLTRITQTARSAFDTDIAAVSIAENGRLTTVACDGAERGTQSQEGSLCDLTIGSDDLVVVTDTWAEPDLQHHRAVKAADSIRFYAGHPMNAPGRPGFGALCVYDRKPHRRSEFDFTLLRDLALLAEGELADSGR